MRRKTEYIRLICLSFMTILFLFVAWFSGQCGEWGRFGVYIACSIIFAMWFSISVTCLKIDERFDRLEKFLSQKDNAEKSTEKGRNSSAKVR